MLPTYSYFLGLRNLTVIHHAEEAIRRIRPDFSIEKIPENDKKVFRMLSEGHTDGVFQFESPGIRQVLVQLRPENLEDIIAVTSLYRPGPMDSIPTYIENRAHPEKIRYKHPLLEDILRVTNGCMIYQEQVMQICQKLAGFSYGQADIVRRAMAKKKADVMAAERLHFLYGKKDENGNILCPGAVANGVPEDVANSIYDEIASFASYAFKKAHAAAYAWIAYETAYLKCYYPREYMSALLTSVLDNTPKVIEYISECKRSGIPVLPPDVNASFEGFTVDGSKIRFGLLAVRNVGRNLIADVIAGRENGGRYTSFYDFCKRLQGRELNRRALESLIKSGALDSLGSTRRKMLTSYETLLGVLEEETRRNIEGQINLFDQGGQNREERFEESYPDLAEYSFPEILSFEKETLGLYVSGHPLDVYHGAAARMNCTPIVNITSEDSAQRYPDGTAVNLLGVLSEKTVKTTKNGDSMAFIELEDDSGIIECILFARVFAEARHLLNHGTALLVSGKISLREDDDPKVILYSVRAPRPDGEAPQKDASFDETAVLYLRMKSTDAERSAEVKRILQTNPGSHSVRIYLSDLKKTIRLPAVYNCNLCNNVMQNLTKILGKENISPK